MTTDHLLEPAWERLTTALWVLDARGRILTANAAAEAFAAKTRRGLAGLDFSTFVEETAALVAHLGAETDEFPRDAQGLSAEGSGSASSASKSSNVSGIATASTLSHFNLGPDGERPVRAVFSRWEEPRIPGSAFLVETIDLTDVLRDERRRLEAEVARANRELLRNLAHEVKNPLGGIRGAAQLLESDLTCEEDRECTGVILDEADRLTRLVERLLEPYRSAERTGPVELHELLEHVKSLIAHEFPEVAFVRDYDVSIPPVLADEGRLTQVFLNLVRNAAEALRGGAVPEPRIELRTRFVRDAFVGDVRRKRALALEVLDNGPGIPEAIRDRIFFPLVTGRAEGSGLGLSLVKSYVEEAGGSVLVESRPGRTVFRVLLPFEPAKPAANQNARNHPLGTDNAQGDRK